MTSSASAQTHQVSSSMTANMPRPSPSILPQPLLHPHPPGPPPPPPKPKTKPTIHATSTLIKQSLQASKTAQTMKKAEEQLEKERVLQVLRSSAVVSGARSFAGAKISGSSILIGSNMQSSGSGSRSPSKRIPASQQSAVAKSDSSASWSGGEERERPPLPRRRQRQQQQPSPPMSTSSLEQVALAVAPSGTRSHPQTPFTSSPFDSPNNSPPVRGRCSICLALLVYHRPHILIGNHLDFHIRYHRQRPTNILPRLHYRPSDETWNHSKQRTELDQRRPHCQLLRQRHQQRLRI